MFGPLLHSSDNTNSSLPILPRTQPSKRIAAHQYLTARHMGVVAKDISYICDDYCDASDNYGNYRELSDSNTKQQIMASNAERLNGALMDPTSDPNTKQQIMASNAERLNGALMDPTSDPNTKQQIMASNAER
eukprot:1160740_1